MKRRKFLADALIAIAVSLVPKILQPVVPELVDVPVKITYNYVYADGDGVIRFPKENEVTEHTIQLSKETADWLWERISSYENNSLP